MKGKWYEEQAKVVREAKLNSGKKLMDITMETGLHSQFISNVTRGKCGIPNQYMYPLAEALGIEVSKLFNAKATDCLNRTMEEAQWAREQ